MTKHRYLLAVCWTCAAPLLCATGTQAASFTVNLEDLTLPANSYYQGPDTPNDFTGTLSNWTSAGGKASFNHFSDTNTAYNAWAGFAYANGTDSTTPGFGNQQSAQPGGGASSNGSVIAGSNFALGYFDSYNNISPTITLDAGNYLTGMYVANSTYAYQYMLGGLDGFYDDPANKFGGLSGTDADYLRLTATGYDSSNSLLGTVDYYLADFRSSNSANDYIRTGWNWLDLSSLGTSASKVTFTVTSSDPFAPAYFAADNFLVAPEPSRALLLLLGGLALANRRRRSCSMA